MFCEGKPAVRHPVHTIPYSFYLLKRKQKCQLISIETRVVFGSTWCQIHTKLSKEATIHKLIQGKPSKYEPNHWAFPSARETFIKFEHQMFKQSQPKQANNSSQPIDSPTKISVVPNASWGPRRTQQRLRCQQCLLQNAGQDIAKTDSVGILTNTPIHCTCT